MSHDTYDHAARQPRFARGAQQADGMGAAKSDRAEERWLFARYQRHGDRAAQEALVNRFLPLARQLARRYARSSEPLEDLVQVASLGLLKAIDRFDPTRATAFSSFAVPTILGELKRHFRDKGWSLRVPRELQELAVRVERVSRRPRVRARSRPDTGRDRPAHRGQHRAGARRPRGLRRLPGRLARPPSRRRRGRATLSTSSASRTPVTTWPTTPPRSSA